MTELQTRLWLGVGIMALAFVAGGYVTRLYYKAEISNVEKNIAEKARKQAEADKEALLDAKAKSDSLFDQLAASERARLALSEEKRREIKRLTTGSACLSADTVRLLNARALPDSGAAPVESVAATGAGSATDTDIAEWIDTAQRYYGQCQDRVNALIRFFDGGDSADKKG